MDDIVAAQYATFSLQYTRLNALRQPKLLARLAVNDWLKERKLIPADAVTSVKRIGSRSSAGLERNRR